MFSREEMIRQKRLERQQKNQNKNEDEFFRTQQEFHREKLRNTRIRLSIDPSKTWDDIKREEEVKRKDRIERRKEELQQTSHYSESLLKSVEKWKTMKSMEEGGGGGERMGRSASVGGGGSAGSQQFSPRRGSRGHVPSPEEVCDFLLLLLLLPLSPPSLSSLVCSSCRHPITVSSSLPSSLLSSPPPLHSPL
jgi:hypothetical protein